MRLQLLLLGAIAALTLGAVSLAGSVPTASISADPTSQTTPSAGASQAPEVATLATPATTAAATTPETVTTTEIASAEPAPEAIPESTTEPAACTAAIQFGQAARGGQGATPKSKIASAIADCVDQLPVGIELPPKKGGSGYHPGGDSGD